MRPNQKLKQLPLTVRVMLFPNALKLEHTNFFSSNLAFSFFVCLFCFGFFFLMIRCFTFVLLLVLVRLLLKGRCCMILLYLYLLYLIQNGYEVHQPNILLHAHSKKK